MEQEIGRPSYRRMLSAAPNPDKSTHSILNITHHLTILKLDAIHAKPIKHPCIPCRFSPDFDLHNVEERYIMEF